jgi:hypothetical protein
MEEYIVAVPLFVIGVYISVVHDSYLVIYNVTELFEVLCKCHICYEETCLYHCIFLNVYPGTVETKM